MSKKLFIKTWGCQMNTYDSKRMVDILTPLGYTLIEEPDNADLIILNTCHIREKATEKLFSDLGRLREHKKSRAEKGKKTLITVAGCVAQAESDVILQRAGYVDLIFGPQTYHLLPEMILKVTKDKRVINTDFPAESKFDFLPESSSTQGASAFLSVQEGCNNFCTFCVVPYTRGAEFSRPPEQVLDEAKSIIQQGAKEITLLGQNVNAWHGKDRAGSTWDLAQLIAEIAKLNGIDRVRYTTSHPKDMDNSLIRAHRDIPKLMPFLHLPVQSGSDRVLELMNRKHTVADYLDTITKLKTARSDLAVSSDFIVGFPGETDSDHQATLDLVRQVGFTSCYSFKYSPRPGTPGAAMKNIVPEDIKNSRLQELQTLLFEQQYNYNKKSIETIVPVLFDRKGRKSGQLLGKTPYMQSVYAEAPEQMFGQIINVRIEKVTQNSITGTVVDAEENSL